MRRLNRICGAQVLAASVLLFCGPKSIVFAQPADITPAGQTVLTFVNRLYLNPPAQATVAGYFANIAGLPGPLFSGAPGEATAYFTWSLDASGALLVANGDANAGGVSVAFLPAGESLNVYFNATPNQTWSSPASFSAGQLVATFTSTVGTQTGSGPVALVTQSYLLTTSHDFVFKGKTYNFADLIPHGFTMSSFSSNIPNPGNAVFGFPLVFPAAGSAVSMGGLLSGLPK